MNTHFNSNEKSEFSWNKQLSKEEINEVKRLQELLVDSNQISVVNMYKARIQDILSEARQR